MKQDHINKIKYGDDQKEKPKFFIEVTHGSNCREVEKVTIHSIGESLYLINVQTKSKHTEYMEGFGINEKGKYFSVTICNEDVNDTDRVRIYGDELYDSNIADMDSRYGPSFILFKDNVGELLSEYKI